MIALLAMVVVVLLLVLLEGFFSGSETVFTSTSKTFVHSLAEKGDPRAKLIRRMLAKAERFLGTTLLGTNLAVASSTTLCQILLARHVLARPAVMDTLNRFPCNWEAVLNTLVMTPVILLFGELLPKSLGRAHADALAPRLARPLQLAGWVLRPLALFIGWIANGLAHLLGGKPSGTTAPHVSRDDLRTIAEIAAEQGLIPEHAGTMLRTIFHLDTRPVAAMMTPLVNVRSLPITATVDEAEAMLMDCRHARFPVFSKRVDEIVGTVDLRSLLYQRSHDPETTGESPIAPFVDRAPVFVPESKSVVDLLADLRYRKTPMIVVVDEHGGVTGIVTVRDLLEEVVGELQDERDHPSTPFERIGDQVLECEGKMDVRELADHLALDLDPDGYETAAGLVLKLAGRIPAEGDTFVLDGYDVVVVGMDRRRIERLRFTRRT
ncbi:MAG: HlyC/CorC family transporter [Victivallales bacterium]|nr:HlyC/CorC family transporter [Victivallales bacterium]MBT7302078.1 HlyC/CorC family transporter [Victivallales bacterium]